MLVVNNMYLIKFDCGSQICCLTKFAVKEPHAAYVACFD